jgi:putative transposase
MHAAQQLAGEIGNTRRACDVMAAPRASLYRRARRLAGPVLVRIAPPRPTPARALDEAERTTVLAKLHEPRFVDLAPAQVHATLLDEGTYLCSQRTMHRILANEHESGERRPLRRHPPAAVPRIVATAPNQVWTWDITKLLGPVRGVSFALYVVLDLFSRFVVGWTIARRELASIAEALLRTTCEKHGVRTGQLTIHSDRGPQMTAQPVAFLFGDLGVTASLSRPRVSNDNPFSEAQFKTTKYRPDYPGRFDSLHHARSWARTFFAWYNTEHRHSSIAMLTPEDVFLGRAAAILEARRRILHAAYDAHPERFVRGRPEPPALPTEVWINRPPAPSEPEESH